MNKLQRTETTNKVKIYTIPEGVYKGSWSGNFVWLIKGDVMFTRFETKHSRDLRAVNVTVTIVGVKATVKIQK